jgi:hypothetical protein
MIQRIFLFFILILIISCSKNNLKSNVKVDPPIKNYSLNDDGSLSSSEISIHDFDNSKECQSCHNQHYKEWNESMHAYSIKDPIFFSGWNKAKHDFPKTGERFCVQCHSPAAFVAGYDLKDYNSLSSLKEADIPDAILDGVSCDICHTMTSLSQTIHVKDDVAANAIFNLNPGESIKYGNIENPVQNSFHKSEYNPIFKRSELCLPCHDLTIRGVEAEITFTEWNRIPGLAMSGALSCQDCHMPQKADGTHDHRFVGVDIDLSYPIGESPLHDAVHQMLESAATIEFGYYGKELQDSIKSHDSLVIPLSVTSLTAHSLPSGTSFAREVWAELIILNSKEKILYQSGVVESFEPLNTDDPELLLFTTTFLDANGSPVNSITQTYDMVDNSLPAFAQRFHSYDIDDIGEIADYIVVKIRLLFRSFKPHLLKNDHPELLDNLPIFEISTISDTVYAIYSD